MHSSKYNMLIGIMASYLVLTAVINRRIDIIYSWGIENGIALEQFLQGYAAIYFARVLVFLDPIACDHSKMGYLGQR